MNQNHSQDPPHDAGAKNKLWRLLRLNVRKHAKRRGLNAVDKQGVAFILTLAVGVIGVTAAWGTGQLRRNTQAQLEDRLQSASISQEEPVQETFEDDVYEATPSPSPSPSQEPRQEETTAAASVSDTLSLFQDPVDGQIVCGFSVDRLLYNETLNEWRTHNGIDYAAEEGTAVTAALDGVVEKIEEDPLLGNCVTLSHDSGVKTLYAGLAAFADGLVEGTKLSRGDMVGTLGATASFEAHLGPHLHFEITTPQGHVDPHA